MLPSPTAPTWTNWSQNLLHKPPTNGEGYYFTPGNLSDLQAIIADAVAKGLTVRVSGQRHSQPPLVTDDNRDAPPVKPDGYLIDMSCYADLGPNADQRMVLDAVHNKLTVNAGVREDEIDAFLTAHNMMLRTVTAGGFFSVGGMTVVDVHGATVGSPIFAETASAFTLVNAEGQVVTIDGDTPSVNGWSPLQFVRVSLGGLGVVTSITLDVLPRPWSTTLSPGKGSYDIKGKAAFISRYKSLVQHTRIESFYNPYAIWPAKKFLAFWWDVVANPTTKTPNATSTVEDACALAGQGDFGAPYESPLEEVLAEKAAEDAQYQSLDWGAAIISLAAMGVISKSVDAAAQKGSDLWLTEAGRVIFMSYYLELPDLDSAGLGRAWDGLNAVASRVVKNDQFHIAAPLEFRFVRGGDTAMAGTYTTNPDSTFVNLDLIGWVPATAASDYPQALLRFFADVERDWVAMGGFPHNGKMYGFYDPTAPAGTCTAPFNPNFLAALRARRGARLQAYDAYRKSVDPGGVFCNAYLKALLG